LIENHCDRPVYIRGSGPNIIDSTIAEYSHHFRSFTETSEGYLASLFGMFQPGSQQKRREIISERPELTALTELSCYTLVLKEMHGRRVSLPSLKRLCFVEMLFPPKCEFDCPNLQSLHIGSRGFVNVWGDRSPIPVDEFVKFICNFPRLKVISYPWLAFTTGIASSQLVHVGIEEVILAIFPDSVSLDCFDHLAELLKAFSHIQRITIKTVTPHPTIIHQRSDDPEPANGPEKDGFPQIRKLRFQWFLAAEFCETTIRYFRHITHLQLREDDRSLKYGRHSSSGPGIVERLLCVAPHGPEGLSLEMADLVISKSDLRFLIDRFTHRQGFSFTMQNCKIFGGPTIPPVIRDSDFEDINLDINLEVANDC